jgi:hypothetical protein
MLLMLLLILLMLLMLERPLVRPSAATVAGDTEADGWRRGMDVGIGEAKESCSLGKEGSLVAWRRRF